MYYNLEALRGICALMVALTHVPWANHLFYSPFVNNAWLFVDFFFVLSGFVIAHRYAGPPQFDFQDFMIRRFFRLYPLHAVTLLACLALLLARDVLLPAFQSLPPRTEFNAEFLWAATNNLFLTHALGFTSTHVLNAPSWSISAEFWTYLVFAAVCSFTSHAGRRVALMLVIGLVAFTTLVTWNTGRGLATPLHFGFLRCLASFGLGTAVWYLASLPRRTFAPVAYDAIFAGLFLVLLVLFASVSKTEPLNAVMPLVFALIVYLCVCDTGSLTSRILETAPMRRLGAWSYSIYMVHAFWTSVFGFVLNRFYTGASDIAEMGPRLATPLMVGDIAVTIYVALVLLTSYLTYSYVERPGREFGTQRARRLARAHPSLTRNEA